LDSKRAAICSLCAAVRLRIGSVCKGDPLAYLSSATCGQLTCLLSGGTPSPAAELQRVPGMDRSGRFGRGRLWTTSAWRRHCANLVNICERLFGGERSTGKTWRVTCGLSETIWECVLVLCDIWLVQCARIVCCRIRGEKCVWAVGPRNLFLIAGLLARSALLLIERIWLGWHFTYLEMWCTAVGTNGRLYNVKWNQRTTRPVICLFKRKAQNFITLNCTACLYSEIRWQAITERKENGKAEEGREEKGEGQIELDIYIYIYIYIYRVAQKTGTLLYALTSYALTSSNIDLTDYQTYFTFSIRRNNVTKDRTTPQEYRYTTFWNASVLKATIENKTTSVTTHFKKLTTGNNVLIV